MTQYDNNLRGALFKNEKTNEKAPDYKGQCEIEGIEYWLSSWIREDKNGKKFMSLSFEKKESKRELATQTKAKVQSRNDFQDSVPF